jgi:hypothetical protein
MRFIFFLKTHSRPYFIPFYSFVFLHRQVRRKTDDETDSYVPCCRHGDSRFVGGVEGK